MSQKRPKNVKSIKNQLKHTSGRSSSEVLFNPLHPVYIYIYEHIGKTMKL